MGETQPDRIVRVEGDGTVTILAEDEDSRAGSPCARFDNGVGATADGRVAFVATHHDRHPRRLPDRRRTTTTTVATEADPTIEEIEFFAPAVNDAGVVVFRAVRPRPPGDRRATVRP
ncbi:MAG: hypothetical protein R2991_05110 [Thermoanaerobaculia bacterium]